MKKLLYVASTSNHLKTFHRPYIEKLRENYDVKIMAKDSGEKFADFDIDFKKRILSFKHFKTVKQIAEILKSEQFDAVVLNTSLASFLVRMAIKKAKIKTRVVNIVHGYFFSRQTGAIKNFFYKLAEKNVRKQTDYILVMNKEDEDYARKYKFAKHGVFMIDGMGFDESRFVGTEKVFEYKSVENPKFLFIGELSKRKNQKFLLKFVDKLKDFNINASLKLLGNGDALPALQKKIKKLGLEGQVTIISYDKDIKKHLDETDYYICASQIEGLPFNILEAMYAGCVILSSDIKGSVDLISDYETGILYKLDDLNDLVAKFRLLNESLSLKQKLSKNAKAAAEKYLFKNVFDDNIKIIKGLLEEDGK